MGMIAVLSGITVALLIGKLLFRLFFEDSSDFWNCVGFSLTPDLFSLFRGEYFEDKLKSLKLGIYLLIVVGAGVLTYSGLDNFLSSPARDPGQAPPVLPAEKPE